jgi:hypothetical protein
MIGSSRRQATHLLLLACLLSPSAVGQTASLRGQVTDETGAIVPGAKVTLTAAGGVERQAVAGDTGAYSFRGLQPGVYALQGTTQQMATAQPARIVLQPGAQTFDLRLKVIPKMEQVSVRENAGALSADPAQNASALVLRGEDLQSLSDNPDDLQADLQALAGPSAGPNGGSIFVDGFSGGEIPPKDSIREIRINQDPFSPEYDKLGYGRIEIFTKPGSARWRGTADYNYANDVWNSRNPYSERKAPLLLNELEGGGGGPLGKRASLTVDAQRNMVDNGAVVNAVRVAPAYFLVQPFSEIFKSPQRFTRITPRVDYQLSQNHTLSARYGFTHGDIGGAGIGGFDEISRGYHTRYTHNTVQVSETAVLGSTVNEVRFQYFRDANQMIALTPGPALQVLGSFNGGGSQLGRSFDTQDSFELQNATSILSGKHTWRFGVRVRGLLDSNVSPLNFNGTFTFAGGLAPLLDANNQPLPDQFAQISSIERYRRTLLFQQLGLSPQQIRALGGGATQFSISAGTAALSAHRVDTGLFVADTWRLRPNLTLAYGMRYEWQTNMHDWRDLAPRVSVAWALGGSARKTVLRAGFGVFYDRFALGNTLAAERYNGIVQQQYVITNPDTFPNLPAASTLKSEPGQLVQRVASDVRAPYILQSAFTVERQLLPGITLAVTYTNSHGLHLLRTRDINAPLPGTYLTGSQGSGVFPLGQPGPVFLIESSGVYNQNQAIANVSAKLNSGLSLFGFYVLNRVRSDTDGVNTSPANPYRYSGEYSPAANDVRHRITAGGSITTRWNVRLSPFVILQSGAPFNITTGSDLYGTTLFNARPGFATGATKQGLASTKYGLLDPDPPPEEKLVPRNYGRGPAQFTVNLRLAKTIGFGPERRGSGGVAAGARPASAAQGNAAATTGSGLRNIIGEPSAPRRYNMIFSLSARNLLNHNNPGPIIGNITSPLFGRANQVAAGPNGEGFSENASNRRLEVQIRFMF